jgi:hypothetical protein
MSFLKFRHSLRALTLLLVCFVLATPLIGSSIFVSAAIPHGECYAGVSERSPAGDFGARHGKATGKVKLLNVFLHLTGTLGEFESGNTFPYSSTSVQHPVVSRLPIGDLVFAIFHPPRANHSSR